MTSTTGPTPLPGAPLPATARRLDLLAARAQSAGRLPSLSDAVLRDGELVWSRQIGALAYGPDGTPTGSPTLSTPYRIGSITKSFTAVLLLQLRDEGVLSLTDPVAAHLPGAPARVRDAFARVRLGDVAAHRGGLAREPDGAWWERTAGPAAADFLAARTPADLLSRAGRTAELPGHHYSNLGYGLLGAVVENHRGRPWRDVLAERILTPLGMAATACAPAVPSGAPSGYSVHPWSDELHLEPTPDTGAMAPAGQLWSTPADLGRWGSFLADPAGVDPAGAVLAAASVAQLRTSRGPAVEGEPTGPAAGRGRGGDGDGDGDGGSGYALGLATWSAGGRLLVGHGGSMPGFLAGLAFHPASRAVAVSLASSYTGLDPTGHAAALLTTLLDAEPTEPAPWRPTVPDTAVRELLGTWWWGDVELLLTCRGDGAVLTLGGRRGETSELVAEDASTWRGRSGEHTGELLTVRRDPAGTPVELTLSTYRLGRRPYEVLPG